MKRTPSSREEQIAEIIKCGRNPTYLINTYMSVQHAQRGTVPFAMYPYQVDCVDAMLKHRFNIVLKSRQLGLSAITAAYAVWLAIYHKDKNILIIATKKDVAMNLMKKIKFMLNSLPKWLVLPTYEETMTSLRFSNGSEIKAVPTSPDAGRSEALSLLIIDEAAIIRDFDDIWTGLAPTLSTGGSTIILSTPYGVGGQYYKLWIEASSGQNDFNPICLPWYVHPEHDEAWFKKETTSLTKKKIAQEYLCSFTASGDTFLQADVLEVLREGIIPPIEKAGHDKNIWIWQKPIDGHKYIISADVARGDAADYSTFHVVDVETSTAVVEYMGKVPPERLAEMMIEYGTKYNKALLAPENNSFGYSTASTLKRSGYSCLYFEKHRGDPFTYISSDDELCGFSTQKNSRVKILTKLEELLRTRKFRMYSQRLLDQLQAFVWIGTKPQAQKDSHDDLIMSLAIAAWIVGGTTDVSVHELALTEAMLMATSKSSNQGFNFVEQVQPLMPSGITGVGPHPRYRGPDARNVLDYSWLLK